jgi:hypothetical protein
MTPVTTTTLAAFSEACNRHDIDALMGDFGCSQWTFTGTAADGSRIETDGIDVFAFKNGEIHLKNAFRKARPNLPAVA